MPLLFHQAEIAGGGARPHGPLPALPAVGIELVEFSTLIPKALLLVLLANLVGLIPCAGPFMALAVWFLGAMLFFQLEIWESRFLVIVNWGMGWLIWLFLVGSLISLVTHTKFDGDKRDDGQGGPPPATSSRVN